MNRYGFLLPLTIPAIAISGYMAGGIFIWSTVIFVFFILPVADWLCGVNDRNPDVMEAGKLMNDSWYRFLLIGWVPIQMIFLVWSVWVAGTANLSIVEWLGFAISVGTVTGGVGITIAHELGHKHHPLDRFLSNLLLASVCYLHFYIEHNKGHHSIVATPEDPATARTGESFYRFWPRTVGGSFVSAWKIELKRLRSQGRGWLTTSNRMLWAVFTPVMITAVIGFSLGVFATIFFLVQSVVAFTLLEMVNYVEHYGLLRHRDQKGQYEKVNLTHSWNSSRRLSNYFLFNLQRHAHHHVHQLTSYQALRHYDESPQLPMGYPGMMLLGLVPPLWRRIMDRKLPVRANHP